MNSTAKGAVAPLSVSIPWGLGVTWGGDFRHDRQQRLDKAYKGPCVGGPHVTCQIYVMPMLHVSVTEKQLCHLSISINGHVACH